jgi:YVTN family beta-propeller protein
MLLTLLTVFAAIASSAGAAGYLGPSAMVASSDGKTLYIAQADAKQIAVFDVAGRKVARTVAVPAEPTALALSADGAKLYVTCAAPKSTVCVIDTASGNVSASIPAGHSAHGVAVTPDGKRLYVCNRFDNCVSVIDLETKREITRVPATREPCGAVVTPDGKSVFVINLVPLDRSDSYDVAANVTVIDTASNQPANVRLLNGSSSVRGVCVSPDGKYVYVVHILSRYQMPTTQLERGWMNTNALSIIDAAGKKLINTVLLDDVDLGAANPWGVTTSADGKTIFVSHAGTHELSVIDAPGVMEKLAKIEAAANATATAEKEKKQPSANIYANSASPTPADVPNDLSFLVMLRRRIKLDGNGPRGVAAIGTNVYLAEYFSDTLAVVDLESKAIKPLVQVALGPKPELSEPRRGQMLFNDATICFQHWQSCESCHPDARVDGLNWDLMNDGLGNPKNSRTMLLVHEAGPVMSLPSVRENAEVATKAGITHILFAVRPDDEPKAMEAYFKSLTATPSPYLVEGKLSPAAERGKKLFFDAKVGCSNCHPEPVYTDKKSHDVGSVGKYDKPADRFNTARLVECWRTAPYMHDGQYLTVKELLTKGKHGSKGGDTSGLSEKDLEDLAEFVNSL